MLVNCYCNWFLRLQVLLVLILYCPVSDANVSALLFVIFLRWFFLTMNQLGNGYGIPLPISLILILHEFPRHNDMIQLCVSVLLHREFFLLEHGNNKIPYIILATISNAWDDILVCHGTKWRTTHVWWKDTLPSTFSIWIVWSVTW